MKQQPNMKLKITKNIKKYQHYIFDINNKLILDLALGMIKKNKSLSLSVTNAGNYILKQNKQGVMV